MDGKEPVCYYRGKVSDFLDPEPEFKWFEFTNDMAVGEVEDSHKAGMVKLKISLHDVTMKGAIDFSKFDTWSRKIPKRPKCM
jgi:hypothetical protein